MNDGIPLYGFYGSDGETPSDLDECSGHDSDLGYYHYHAQRYYPYMLGCLRGRRLTHDEPCDAADIIETIDYSTVLPNWTLKWGFLQLAGSVRRIETVTC